MCICRAAKLADLDGISPGKHFSVKRTEMCAMCGLSNSWSFHGPSSDTKHSVMECCQCNNYLKYFDKCSSYKTTINYRPYKEEFYVSKYCIINAIDYSEMIIYNNSNLKLIGRIPKFSFKDEEHLLKKIETYLPFL
jgi:hypothetical protein